MPVATTSLSERLAELGGQLQKLRWEALDNGQADTARDIAHAIEAVAWAAGIYSAGANIVDRPGTPASMQSNQEENQAAHPDRVTQAA